MIWVGMEANIECEPRSQLEGGDVEQASVDRKQVRVQYLSRLVGQVNIDFHTCQIGIEVEITF